jgi:surfeit locus 1 family protein
MFMPFPEITLPMTPNSPPRPGFRLHLPWLLLTVAGMSVFVALGRWQWQRAAEKRVIEAAFVAAASAPATPLGAGSLGSLPRYSPIEATGQYDAAHSFLLDNVTEGGQAGYQIVTPLELTDGRWILVNRGWVPLVKRARSELPEVQQNLPAGVVTIRGLVDELPVPGLAAGRVPATSGSAWPRVTSFPQTADLGAALGHPVEPRQILLAADEPGGYLRNWKPASASFPPDRHVAYAVQWWSLACLVVGLYLFMNFRRRKE